MFSLAFFIAVLSTSTSLLSALVCGTNCSFFGQIGNAPIPRCDVIDKPLSQQSCAVHIAIDYFSNEITGYLKPGPSFLTIRSAFTTETWFSLYNDASNVTVDFGCSTGDRCDSEFLAKALTSDWISTQTQAKVLRKTLADTLFNASDLRPTETCPSRQPCSGQGFCEVSYFVSTSGTPVPFESYCANSTEKPVIGWLQTVEYRGSANIVGYTCNKPACASQGEATSISQMIQRDYVLPFNVTIPTTAQTPTTPTLATTTSQTTTTSETSSTTSAQTTSSTTSETSTTTTVRSRASGIHLKKIEHCILALLFFAFRRVSHS